jgi:rubredoxin
MTTRKCAGCGYSFRPDGPDDPFCSGICAGTPTAYSLLFAVQQFARLAARGQ